MRGIIVGGIIDLIRALIRCTEEAGAYAVRGFGFAGGAILAIAIFGPSLARGDTLYLGAVSDHIGGGDYCELHPAVFYDAGEWMGGAFRNSYCDVVVFAGKRYRHDFTSKVQGGLMIGAMYGYDRGAIELFGRTLDPIITLDLRFQFDIDSWAIPDRPSFFQLGPASALVPGWSID